MGRDKNQTGQVAKQTPESSRKDAFSHVDVEILPPETAEDFLLMALEKSGVAEIVRILRDWCGSKEIRRALNKLPHRDPVDRFTHIRRHAVEIYAANHGITPANLMVKLTGRKGRADAEGVERGRLREARKYLEQDGLALSMACALAEAWEASRPKDRDAEAHIKKIDQACTALSPVSISEF